MRKTLRKVAIEFDIKPYGIGIYVKFHGANFGAVRRPAGRGRPFRSVIPMTQGIGADSGGLGHRQCQWDGGESELPSPTLRVVPAPRSGRGSEATAALHR